MGPEEGRRMKRAIGWCLLWCLYVADRVLSKIIGTRRNWLIDRVVYPAYQRLMSWAADVQDWSGVNGPWSKP